MRDLSRIVARPKGVLQSPVNKDLVWRTPAKTGNARYRARDLVANPQASKCDIYFVRMEVADRPIKIGRSVATGKRFKMLQCGSPYPLTCIGLLYGEGEFEPEWHRRFADQRMFGEWFRPTSALENAIKVALEQGSRAALGIPEPVDWRAELGLAPLKSG